MFENRLVIGALGVALIFVHRKWYEKRAAKLSDDADTFTKRQRLIGTVAFIGLMLLLILDIYLQ